MTDIAIDNTSPEVQYIGWLCRT